MNISVDGQRQHLTSFSFFKFGDPSLQTKLCNGSCATFILKIDGLSQSQLLQLSDYYMLPCSLFHIFWFVIY